MGSIGYGTLAYGVVLCRGSRKVLNLRMLSQLHPAAANTVTVNETAHKVESLYPPVKPRFPPGLWGRMSDKNAWKWHDKGVELLKHPKLQERLDFLAGSEEKGHWQATPFLTRRHALAGVQYMTKTRLRQSLPESYKRIISSLDDSSLKTAETLVLELIAQDSMIKNNDSYNVPDIVERDAFSRLAMLRQLITVMCSLTAKQHPAIIHCQLAERASVEAAWQRWGYKHPDVRTTTKDQGGIRVQSIFRPDFILRSEHPLSPVLKSVDDLLPESDAGLIPDFTYSPNCLGIRSDTIKPSWLPGFKTGDPCEFGVVQIVDVSSYLASIESEYLFKKHPHIVQELLNSCAAMAGFTWAAALAHYQGFSMFHDVAYPFTVQTVLTDTTRFMFSTYQLNTLSLFKDGQSPNGNLRENACWTTGLMPLCSLSESPASKTVSVDALRLLLSFFRYPIDAQNPPVEKRRPYLPDDPSPLLNTEPVITNRTPIPPEVHVVDEFWKV